MRQLEKKVFRIYGEKTFTNVVQETAGGLANSLSVVLDANQDPLPSPHKNGNSGDFFNIMNIKKLANWEFLYCVANIIVYLYSYIVNMHELQYSDYICNWICHDIQRDLEL